MNKLDTIFISSRFIPSFNHLVQHIMIQRRSASQLGVLKQMRFEALKNSPTASSTLIAKFTCIACMLWRPILQRIIQTNLQKNREMCTLTSTTAIWIHLLYEIQVQYGRMLFSFRKQISKSAAVPCLGYEGGWVGGRRRKIMCLNPKP
jgi:hypothetical protein